MACHMIVHRFAITPRMDFRTKGLGLGEVGLADPHIHDSLSQSQPNIPPIERSTGWFGFWETDATAPDFIVTEALHTVEDVENVGDDTNPFPNLA